MSQQSGVKKILKYILMTLGLGIIGIAFGAIGAFIGGRLLGANSVGFGALGLAIEGIIVGYPAGIIVGIVLIRKVLHQKGSLLLGIVGSIIGAVIVMVLAEPLHLNSNTNLLFGTFLVIIPIFCLIGFYLRR